VVGRVRERLGLPVVANGDIWTVEGFRRCLGETGCRHVMLGRGALANPGLAHQVAAELGIVRADPKAAAMRAIDWPAELERLVEWTHRTERSADKAVFRMKQWLKMAATFGTFTGFEAIKRARSMNELLVSLRGGCLSGLSRPA
jgi:tRNA-dihydrouridine synthase C